MDGNAKSLLGNFLELIKQSLFAGGHGHLSSAGQVKVQAHGPEGKQLLDVFRFWFTLGKNRGYLLLVLASAFRAGPSHLESRFALLIAGSELSCFSEQEKYLLARTGVRRSNDQQSDSMRRHLPLFRDQTSHSCRKDLKVK